MNSVVRMVSTALPMDLFSLYVFFSHYRLRDVLTGIFLLFFFINCMCICTCVRLFPGVASRGHKWEDKTCRLKRSFRYTLSLMFTNFREFSKLRRLLQRKRHIETELCVKLSVLRLFHVGHVVQSKQSSLSLAWQEWFSCKGRE